MIRILVPLVATDEQMDEGLDVLESGLAAVCGKRSAAERTEATRHEAQIG